MNKDTSEQTNEAAGTPKKKEFRQPQLTVYGRVADLTLAVRNPKTTADNIQSGAKSGL